MPRKNLIDRQEDLQRSKEWLHNQPAYLNATQGSIDAEKAFNRAERDRIFQAIGLRIVDQEF